MTTLRPWRLLALAATLVAAARAFAPRPPTRTMTTTTPRIIATTTASTTALQMATTPPPPQPLASEGDWTAYLDAESTGLVYYFNGKTGQSLWEPPTATFPIVSLPDDVRRQAEAKRLAYIRSVQTQERQERQKRQEQESSGQSDATAATDAEQSSSSTTANKESWFNFLFDDASTDERGDAVDDGDAVDAADATTSTSTDDAASSSPSWFASLFKSDSGEDDATQTAPTTTTTAPETATATTTTTTPAPAKLTMATCVLPHPQKIFWGGEDAVFTSGRTFGVFDGVSGARKLDGVPLYSKTLATEMKRQCSQSISSSNDTTNSVNVNRLTEFLQKAREVADDTSTGASTALVASVTSDGFLRALNVGDSACLVVRDGRVVARTREISHFFECPYQLSVDSPDRPRDGTRLNVELVRGDTIVAGSDGVFDNLSEAEIVEVVEMSSASPDRLGPVAKRLADRSRRVSLDKRAATPYAKLAQKNGDPDFADGLGGKVDDVSCVVAYYA